MPLAGHDARLRLRTGLRLHFNPRAPCGARRLTIGQLHLHPPFQSTCPLRGTTMTKTFCDKCGKISIHVPLAGHDGANLSCAYLPFAFQSTCPLRGTTTPKYFALGYKTFQSTCPLRGTTGFSEIFCSTQHISIHVPLAGHDSGSWSCYPRRNYFNPRAPCGARRSGGCSGTCGSSCISIHVPLAGHDPAGPARAAARQIFQSTCPLRGTTYALFHIIFVTSHFNPRAPCGARPLTRALKSFISPFQSTCPLRGTTSGRGQQHEEQPISIHVPLAGHDARADFGCGLGVDHFNPRAPCGARPICLQKAAFANNFNPRAPCGARRAGVD